MNHKQKPFKDYGARAQTFLLIYMLKITEDLYMTICIAAICDEGKNAIGTSDRMITITMPPIEYEHAVPKIGTITKSCVALTSGSALAHTDLCREATAGISGISAPTTKTIVDKIVECYIEQRKRKIEQEILKSRGFTFDTFYPNLRNLPPEIGITIDARIETFDFNLELLVTGVDKSGGHIYQVDNPGTANCFDSLGYGSIGSGWHHAVYSLIANNYTSLFPMKEAVYLVYEAKKRAESAPGVGRDTDMCIITPNGIKTLSEKVMSRLNEIYEKKMEIERSRTKEIDQLIKQLKL